MWTRLALIGGISDEQRIERIAARRPGETPDHGEEVNEEMRKVYLRMAEWFVDAIADELEHRERDCLTVIRFRVTATEHARTGSETAPLSRIRNSLFQFHQFQTLATYRKDITHASKG